MTRSRNRAPLYATIGVVLALGIGLTSVALVGSEQRRDDRAAYLRYERALLPALKEGGRIVVQQMRPSLPELAGGKIDVETAISRASGWRSSFAQIRAKVIALVAPAFLGDVERRWTRALDGYLQIPDLFEEAAASTGAARTETLDRATAAGKRADELFDGAASVMQAHRRRLGLGVTHDLPDPA